MPTENEKKLVLNPACESSISKIAKNSLKLSQGYLMVSRGISLRVRKVKNHKTKYYMTFKSSVNCGRVVEIEKKIDQRDFLDLWDQALNKLEKVRYLVKDKSYQIWEIDFFKDHNNETYFCLAELEMPENQVKPISVPSFITENLLYDVLLTDSRFSSKLLSDVRYSINLLKSIKGERNDLQTSKKSTCS